MASDSGGAGFAPCPEGVTLAVCTRVVDLGTQYNKAYDKHSRKVLVQWETDHTIDAPGSDYNGKPYVVSNSYTLSLHEKASLRQHLEAWRGKAFTEIELAGFDVCNVVGIPCQLQIIHNESGGKTYANIASIMAMPKGVDGLQPTQTPVTYSIDDDGLNIPDGIPEWMTKLIMESPEYIAISGSHSGMPDASEPPEETTDDVPF